MQLIVIAGQAGVGKTTLAHYIAQHSFEIGLVPKILSFAGPLKEEAVEKGYDKETHPKEYREYCQTIGLLKREEDPDYWVHKFEDQLEEIAIQETKDLRVGKSFWERCVIVDDCRFLNELNTSRKWNARLIFMAYGSREMKDPDGEWRTHPSEDLANRVVEEDEEYRDMFTHIIINNGTEEALEEKAAFMTPIWCGVNVEPLEDKNPTLNKYIEELIDLLILGELDDEPEEEETDEGIS
tara:strand:- start:6 stop:722 length:717 start_codon:yes stop_codon:yes gene_type:complete